MIHLLRVLLTLLALLAFVACDESKSSPSRELKSGGWRLVDPDKSQSGERELQVYATTDNPTKEINLRFKLPMPLTVQRSSHVGGMTILVLDGEEGEYRFDYHELLSQKGQYREDVLLSLEPFRIKNGQQDGAGQPATRSKSESAGDDKLSPEAEGRSR